MKQQINLYTPRVAAARDIWSLPSIIMLVLLMTLVMGFGAWGVTQYADAKVARLNVLQEQDAGLPEQIALLENQLRDMRPDQSILDEQLQIRKQIAEKKELADLLSQMQPGSVGRGFSPYLYGLAASSRQGVWVTTLDINLMKRQVTLTGISRTADEVPLLLRDLGETDAFAAIRVEDFSVAKQKSLHSFKVLANVTGGTRE